MKWKQLHALHAKSRFGRRRPRLFGLMKSWCRAHFRGEEVKEEVEGGEVEEEEEDSDGDDDDSDEEGEEDE